MTFYHFHKKNESRKIIEFLKLCMNPLHIENSLALINVFQKCRIQRSTNRIDLNHYNIFFIYKQIFSYLKKMIRQLPKLPLSTIKVPTVDLSRYIYQEKGWEEDCKVIS